MKKRAGKLKEVSNTAKSKRFSEDDLSRIRFLFAAIIVLSVGFYFLKNFSDISVGKAYSITFGGQEFAESVEINLLANVPEEFILRVNGVVKQAEFQFTGTGNQLTIGIGGDILFSEDLAEQPIHGTFDAAAYINNFCSEYPCQIPIYFVSETDSTINFAGIDIQVEESAKEKAPPVKILEDLEEQAIPRPIFDSLSVLKLFGQKNVKETSRNAVTGNGIYHASGVIVDRSTTPNKVYIVDSGNNRILGFDGIGYCSNDPSESCTNDLDCPASSCFIDGTKSADIVIGQPDFESASCNGDNDLGINKNPRADTLCLIGYPSSNNIAEHWMRKNFDVDNEGNLYVPDVSNNRILKYNQPFSSDKSNGKGDAVADFVLGQDDFNSNGINRGSNFGAPRAPDDHSIWISSGPPDHVSSRGVSVDSQGNVWVADTFNNRILRFPPNSKDANLVLGQSSFTSSGCPPEYGARFDTATNELIWDQNDPRWNNSLPFAHIGLKDKLCTPTLAKINPANGKLYVTDEYPAPFKARILVFNPPFSNGMQASKVIIANQDVPFKNADENYTFRATGFIFNTFNEGEYASGTLWVNEGANRVILLDDDGNIIKVIGASDKSYVGGDTAYQHGCGSIYDGFNLWWPGGSLGIDNANNIYLADERFHSISRYALPYETYEVGDSACLPLPNGGLFPGNPPQHGRGPNKWSDEKLGESIGVAVLGNQLIVQDENRLKIWNNYLTKGIGAKADFEVSGNNLVGSRRLLSDAIDDANRLWMFNEHGQIRVDQLPYKRGDVPLANFVKLYWQDNGTELVYYTFSGIAFDKINKKLYLVDAPNNRILRVSNYNDFSSGNLMVDMVIGQPDKDTISCNHGSSAPVADGLCEPYQIKFDKLGNLYVVENNYECHGNRRITVFMAEDLKNSNTLFPNIKAKKVFGAKSLTELGPCAYWTINEPGTGVSIAFNSKNQLVIGNDGYYGNPQERSTRQLWLYRNPLNKQSPDAYVNVPMGTPGELVFDSNDNLIIQDHTWSRVLVVNLDADPELVVPLAPRLAAAIEDSWKVGTSTKKLEISEDLITGTNRETIRNITTLIDDSELDALASGTASNAKGDAPYNQYLYLLGPDTSVDSGYVTYAEDNHDVTADFLYFKSGTEIGRYLLEFTTSFESNISTIPSSGGGGGGGSSSPSTTNDNLTDFEDAEITMFGKTYTMIEATRNGGNNGQIKLILSNGAEIIELKDSNVTDTVSSYNLKVNDKTINSAYVIIEGTDDDVTFGLDRIHVNMTADDDFYVPANGRLSEIIEQEGSEQEVLFTNKWDIEYRGLKEEPIETIEIATSGNKKYKLKFKDGDGNEVSLPLAEAVGDSALEFGEKDRALINVENKVITKDDYLILTDSSQLRGERKTYVLQYKGADKITDNSSILKFRNLGSGEIIEQVYTNATPLATLSLGGADFGIYKAPDADILVNDFDIRVDLDADTNLDVSRDYITITTFYGAEINITNETDNRVDFTVKTPDNDRDENAEDNVETLQATDLKGYITASSGSVGLQRTDNLNFRTPNGEVNVAYAYTSYGAFITITQPAAAPPTLKIEYPENQREALVYYTIKEESVEEPPVDDDGGSNVTIPCQTSLDCPIYNKCEQNVCVNFCGGKTLEQGSSDASSAAESSTSTSESAIEELNKLGYDVIGNADLSGFRIQKLGNKVIINSEARFDVFDQSFDSFVFVDRNGNTADVKKRQSNGQKAKPKANYIVELLDKPLLEEKSELEKKLEMQKASPKTIKQKLQQQLGSYEQRLKNAKAEAIEEMLEVNANIESKIVDDYKNVFNGFSVELTEQEALELEELPSVKNVYRNEEVHALLEESVNQINADELWRLKDDNNRFITGKGVTIGIIDTGVDYTHEDLGGCLGNNCKVIDGYDFVNEDNDPMDDHGHGTHVAATAAGNGILKGVAPDAKIVAYKVLDSGGSGSWDGIVQSIERSVDPNQDGDFSDHLDIISMSLGGPGDPDDPISKAIDNAVEEGVIAVIAAGNSGPYEQSIGSPGTAREAITVGAVEKCDSIARFSSRGPVVWENGILLKPDLMAPGVEICAAQFDDWLDDRACKDDKHIAISGTSMATPHVSGAAALLLQSHPQWSPEIIKSALMSTSLDLGLSPTAQGAGRINVLGANDAEIATEPQSIAFEMPTGQLEHTEVITIKNLIDEDMILQLEILELKDQNGNEQNFSSLNVSQLNLIQGSSEDVGLTFEMEGAAEGFFSGKVLVRSSNKNYIIPFIFEKLSKLTVRAVSNDKKLHPSFMLHDETLSNIKYIDYFYIEDSLDGNSFTFKVPAGAYTAYAIGEFESELNYILMDTIEVPPSSEVELVLKLEDARPFIVKAESLRSIPLKLYQWSKGFNTYNNETLTGVMHHDPIIGNQTVYISNKPDNNLDTDILIYMNGVPAREADLNEQ